VSAFGAEKGEGRSGSGAAWRREGSGFAAEKGEGRSGSGAAWRREGSGFAAEKGEGRSAAARLEKCEQARWRKEKGEAPASGLEKGGERLRRGEGRREKRQRSCLEKEVGGQRRMRRCSISFFNGSQWALSFAISCFLSTSSASSRLSVSS